MNTITPHRPFDSNRAWQHAVALVKANRDLLLALAGVFVVLPAFAIAVIRPAPEINDGATMMAYIATVRDYQAANAPYLIASALVHMAGSLAMMALFTDSSRPTVAEAIKLGFTRLPTVVLAQIVVAASAGAMLLVPGIIGASLGSPGLAFAGSLLGLGLGVWAIVRVTLLAPAVTVERIGNPIAALRRSWQLTEGNALRLLAFYLLVLVAWLITMLLTTALVHALFTVLFGAEAGSLGATLLATMLQGALTIYLAAIFAASYWQLSGESSGLAAQTFS